MNDDELYDDPFVQALLAPGTAAELTGEGAALAAFQAANGGRRRGHLRLITGTSAVVLTLALSGGVAAAYTNHLPQPLQSAAHRFLGPLSVPAPRVHAIVASARRTGTPHQHSTQSRPVIPASSPRPASRALPAVSPSAAQVVAVVTTTSGPVATATATVSPTASPTPSPTPSTTPAPPPTVTAASSAGSVPIHHGVTLKGSLRRDGKPLAGRVLYANELVVGTSTWKRIGSSKTTSGGAATLAVPALTRNVKLRWSTSGGATSPAVLVVVLPKVTVKLTRASATQYVVQGTADGAVAGDTATLLRYDGSKWVAVTSKKLTSGGKVRFTVAVPANDRRYRIRVSASKIHGVGLCGFTARAA